MQVLNKGMKQKLHIYTAQETTTPIIGSLKKKESFVASPLSLSGDNCALLRGTGTSVYSSQAHGGITVRLPSDPLSKHGSHISITV